MENTKQCYCSKCRRELQLGECIQQDDGYHCPSCDKKLRSELIRNKGENKNLEFGTRSDGTNYNIRTNRGSYLSPEQWIKFFNTLDKRQQITFMFLIHTGGRIMEVQNLKPENINIENKLITFEITKKRSARGERRCKPRPVKMSSVFISWYLENNIENKINNKKCFDILTTAGANIIFKKILQRIGVQDYYMFSIHNIRKTHETWLISIGYDIIKVAKRLGHDYNTAMSNYIQEDIFKPEQKELIRQILGDDIYSD